MWALLLLLIAGGTDAEFLAERVKELGQRYEQMASRLTPVAIHERTMVVRELGHLPVEDAQRARAGRILARIVAEDRSYRVRAEAACAVARVGTADAMEAMYTALFGPQGREPRFDLLYTVLPEALAQVRHQDDLDWIAARVLAPAAGKGDAELLRLAGPLEEEIVILTLAGLARGRAAAIGPAIVPLASADDPRRRAAAVAALVALDIPDEAVDRALADKDERVRAAAAGTRLGKPGHAASAASDPSALVRVAAIRGLAGRQEPEAVDLLIERLRKEPLDCLRLEIAEALHRITGKDFGTDPDLWAGWWSAARETWDGSVSPEPGDRAYFFDVGLRTLRVTFVIDVSASMAAVDDAGVSRLAYAARELQRAIAALPPAARFRVLAFSAEVRGWPPAGHPPGDRADARSAVEALLAQRAAGATNTYAALMTALADPFEPDSIVLLSDGRPYRCAYGGKTYSEPEQILAEVRRVNAAAAVRIHAIALLTGRDKDATDQDVAADFLSRLAAGNRGEFREIR